MSRTAEELTEDLIARKTGEFTPLTVFYEFRP